jgi:hypothetical protein
MSTEMSLAALAARSRYSGGEFPKKTYNEETQKKS